ncbi:MAG: ferritin, partial [Maribacter sp.]|nr:ferritin [Maribacter sp.]
LVKMSHEEEDWATWNFMQWFVKEQVEEETLVMNLLDKMKIAGGEKMSSNALYSFDKDMEETSDEVRPAQEVTTENP